MKKSTRAAIWTRVSTGEQETGNQLHALRTWAKNRGLTIGPEWEVEESAFTGEHRGKLSEALNAARLGEFDVLLVWSLDRLSREGVEATLALLRQFHERGVAVWSHEESFTETSDPHMRELLASIYGWMAKQESQRRSERIKAAIASRKERGTWTGRGKDTRKRRTSGYLAREARKRAGLSLS
jgi:DNA invertase Pin-like site-specific DNA recombinase